MDSSIEGSRTSVMSQHALEIKIIQVPILCFDLASIAALRVMVSSSL